MVKITHATKLEIVRLFRLGKRKSGILKILNSKGINVSRHIIDYWLKQYKNGNFVENQEIRHSVSFKKVSQRDAEIIKETLIQDPTLSSTDIHRILKQDGADFSLSTTQRAIKATGFESAKPRYCQMIRDVNKEKRVNFCKELIEANDNFSDVIFSDECTVQLHNNKVSYYRHSGLGSLQSGIAKPKHPLKLHIWAAISRKGPSKLTIFDGIMEKVFFTNNILRDNLLPFIQLKFRDGHRFQQDNDPKHRSKMAKEFMENNGINWWSIWPAESPDLNPIEMVWNELKIHVSKAGPRTKQELQNSIANFWCGLTPDRCNRYIDHMYKVVPVCVIMEGKATADIPNVLFRERSSGKSIQYFVDKLKTQNIRELCNKAGYNCDLL